MKSQTFLSRLVGAVFLMCAATAASAEQVLFCEIDDRGGRNLVPTEVLIRIADNGSATVDTELLRQLNLAPYPAEFVDVSAKKTRVRWKIENLNVGSQQADVEYRFYYTPATDKAVVRFRALGYRNKDHGDGTCTVKS